MSSFPSLPLFTDAFLADTGHLSAQETGAYVLLLMMAWRLPECRIPNDDAKLSRWARMDRRTWLRVKPVVMEFWTLQDGFWTQKRLSKERDVVSKRAEVARQNGKHGGRPKSLENNGPAHPTSSVRDTQWKAPNPNPIEKENTKEKSRDPETRSAEHPPHGGSRATPNLQPDKLSNRRGSAGKAGTAEQVWVWIDTPQWAAWCDYFAAIGEKPPRAHTSRHFPGEGYAFPVAWPPSLGYREAAE
jgi:uncharacterized protein YdaU (DUF1376 family)